MPFPEVAYEDFTEEFGCRVSSEEFRACLPHARALVRGLIWPNEPATPEQEDAYMLAVCAAVEADAEGGCGHGLAEPGGFAIGSFSVSGAPAEAGSQAMAGAARRQLAGSGLLYMGVGQL